MASQYILEFTIHRVIKEFEHAIVGFVCDLIELVLVVGAGGELLHEVVARLFDHRLGLFLGS